MLRVVGGDFQSILSTSTGALPSIDFISFLISGCRLTTIMMTRYGCALPWKIHRELTQSQGQFFPFFVLTIAGLVTIPLSYSLIKPSKGPLEDIIFTCCLLKIHRT